MKANIKQLTELFAKTAVWFRMKKEASTNKDAKIEQIRNALILLAIAGMCIGFYAYSEHAQKKPPEIEDAAFDGTFDTTFNQASDEALIEKQQHELNALKDVVDESKKQQEEALKASAPDENTKALMEAMQEKLAHLEAEHQKTNEQLQVALAMNAQSAGVMARPPTREEMEEARLRRIRANREMYMNAGLETVQFNTHRKKEKITRTHRNYVWAGTFVEGVLLTGILGDAGINGSKNMGTALIRLTSGGIMPNEQRSHLEGCTVLCSTYGDLSGSSVVLHLETLSCASKSINFEQKAYGSVFDLDAMQDLRGTSILKTKPLLGYTAAAGMLAGIGDGLANYGSAQSINSNGSVMTFSPSRITQSAAGGALINPANRISDYVMKIADIYHPLVVARAGRRVSVLFTKGFWIDKEHQVYESEKAIDEASAEPAVKTTVSQLGSSTTLTDETQANSGANQTQGMESYAEDNSRGEQDFVAQHMTNPTTTKALPLFSNNSNGVMPHG